MRRLAIIIVALALAAPAAASVPVQHLGSHAARLAPLVPTCHLNRQRLTLCDIRRASANLARRDSFDGSYSVSHCRIVRAISPGCYASDSLAPATLPDLGLTITGDTGPMIWTGRTHVILRVGRICATWVMIYGSACV